MDVAGQIANLVVYVLLLSLLVFTWRAIRKRKFSPQPVADGPPDESYRAYTRAYDCELVAGDVHTVLPEASPDGRHGWYQRDHALWLPCIPRIGRLLSDQAERGLWNDTLSSIRIALERTDLPADDMVLSLLIDQSGSMKGARIAWAAVLATQLSKLAAEIGFKLEVLGFSTAGWHGGYPRSAWIKAGRPPRPGRLCALMHVVYKSADEPMLDEAARNVMLDPALLRENVDGEALLWAHARLLVRAEPMRLLIVVSDGAPVDDSTLFENGPSYLYRHHMEVLAMLASDERLILGGLGIGHDVSAFYPLSQSIHGPDDLAPAIAQLLSAMIAQSSVRVGGSPTSSTQA
jgi:cobaltochelatase CobT